MNNTAYLSGQYARWYAARTLGVPKKCRRIRINGVNKALSNKSYNSVVFKINDIKQLGWKRKNDYIILKKELPRGNYGVSFEIVYDYLESPVYSNV